MHGDKDELIKILIRKTRLEMSDNLYIYIFICLDNIEIYLMKVGVCTGLNWLRLSSSDRYFEHDDGISGSIK
jgi:hypothetical protein